MNSNTNAITKPLVSVVTPVYQGEKYLTECIESVIAQTYINWEYVIVNNCSTDRSREIAVRYAKGDPRIRVVDNETFLTSFENQNNALHKISSESKYCKILHADDWLFPECIEKMVELSEDHPNIGIVSSYVLSDNTVFGNGLPYTETAVPGSVPCKLWLLDGKYLFGNPSSLLIRSDLLRSRQQLYDETYINTDQLACFDLLRDCDFGFIHQILSYMRIHEEQISSLADRCKIKALDKLILLHYYGADHLTKEELSRCYKSVWSFYYRDVGRHIVKISKKECWEYHQWCALKMGYSFNTIVKKSIMLRMAAILKKPFAKLRSLTH